MAVTPGRERANRCIDRSAGLETPLAYKFIRNFTLYFYNSVVSNLPITAIRHAFYRLLFPVGKQSMVMWGVWIRGKRIRIGDNCVINSRVMLDGRGAEISIGNNVDVAPYVQIWTREHDPRSPTHAGQSGPVSIGDHVWLAANAIILPGVKIGEGAVVGVGAIVTKDVPPWTIVAGNPARPIGERPPVADYRLSYSIWFN